MVGRACGTWVPGCGPSPSRTRRREVGGTASREAVDVAVAGEVQRLGDGGGVADPQAASRVSGASTPGGAGRRGRIEPPANPVLGRRTSPGRVAERR